MRKQILIVDGDDRQIRRIAGVVKETAVQSGNRMEIYVANTLEEAGIIETLKGGARTSNIYRYIAD